MYWITTIWPFSRLGKNFLFYGSRKKNEIALTFDDGPSKQTDEVLKILTKYKVKGTFFVIGKKIKENPSAINKIIKQGSEIGNHSYNHETLSFKPKNFIMNEIDKTDELLSKYKVKTLIFRPPHGSFSFNLISIIKEKKMKSIFWDVDPKDCKCDYNANERANYILKRAKNGSIIDLHDYADGIGDNEKLIELLEIIIPLLKKRGYNAVTISDLFNLDKQIM